MNMSYVIVFAMLGLLFVGLIAIGYLLPARFGIIKRMFQEKIMFAIFLLPAAIKADSVWVAAIVSIVFGWMLPSRYKTLKAFFQTNFPLAITAVVGMATVYDPNASHLQLIAQIFAIAVIIWMFARLAHAFDAPPLGGKSFWIGVALVLMNSPLYQIGGVILAFMLTGEISDLLVYAFAEKDTKGKRKNGRPANSLRMARLESSSQVAEPLEIQNKYQANAQ